MAKSFRHIELAKPTMTAGMKVRGPFVCCCCFHPSSAFVRDDSIIFATLDRAFFAHADTYYITKISETTTNERCGILLLLHCCSISLLNSHSYSFSRRGFIRSLSRLHLNLSFANTSVDEFRRHSCAHLLLLGTTILELLRIVLPKTKNCESVKATHAS